MQVHEAQIMILQDVISHFNSTNRSIVNNRCVYNGDDGNLCAAARWMISPNLAKENASIREDFNASLLKPDAKLAGIGFMRSIQDLHDTTKNWTPDGLSESGIEITKEICLKNNIDFKNLKITMHGNDN